MIYEDRIRTYRQMKVLDERLDTAPTDSDVKEMAELRIQNLLCFRELQSLNDRGVFLNEHPYLKNRADYEELLALWNSDRDRFIRQYENCRNNIRRYIGRMNRRGATAEAIEEARRYKTRHEQRAAIFKKILSHANTGS
ncbi:hypothetical protein [uncultured Rikenella sp.]|uniref:hypothetical protein n=1 Tax=uncultured Rikenella sp. TaxID=368003 RepID=UPI00272B677D|nr:hypothetical protein [uncultured Rikenella sp.]